MKTTYLYLIVLVLIFAWSCAESELDFEEETLTTFQLNALPDKLTVSDFLGKSAPEKLQESMSRVLDNEFGIIVLRKVKAKYPDTVFTRFRPLLDENGEIKRTPPMLLLGFGTISYTINGLTKDGLLFHEFFHLFQNPKDIVVQSRNNEVEAYVAQYLYNEKGWEKTISKYFDEAIQKMASCIDKSTGYFKEGTDFSLIETYYSTALDWLEACSVYSGDGWFSNRNFDKSNPFPNILKLYREN